MESILTVRLDSLIKERGTSIMREYGCTPSQAVRKLFDYVVKNDALPFADDEHPDKASVKKKIAAFDALRISESHLDAAHGKDEFGRSFSKLTDDDIRNARLKDRYGFNDR